MALLINWSNVIGRHCYLLTVLTFNLQRAAFDLFAVLLSRTYIQRVYLGARPNICSRVAHILWEIAKINQLQITASVIRIRARDETDDRATESAAQRRVRFNFCIKWAPLLAEVSQKWQTYGRRSSRKRGCCEKFGRNEGAAHTGKIDQR